MPIGKSRRIVIDVEDVGLKRELYSALTAEGRSLKEWFSAAAQEYLDERSLTQRRTAVLRVSELPAPYQATRKGGA